MKRALSFRTRLLLVVLPSLLVLAALGLAATLPRLAGAKEARQAEKSGRVGESAMLLFDEVQQESTLSARFLHTHAEAARADLVLQRAKTDQKREAFRALTQPLSVLTDDGVNGLSKPAMRAADNLEALRKGVDGFTLVTDQAFTDFAKVQRSLVLLAGTAVRSTGNKTLNALGNQLSSYLEAKELKGLVYTYPASRLDGTRWTDAEVSTFASLQVAAERGISTFKATADVETIRAYGILTKTTDFVDADRLASEFVLAGQRSVGISLSSDVWVQKATNALKEVNSLEDKQFASYNLQAANLTTSERNSATLYVVLAMAGLLSAALAAFFVGRSLTSRLRRVTKDAHFIAVDQLPTVLETLRNPTPEALAGALPQVRSDKNDEIGQLATDFNTILRTSIETSIEHSQRQAATMTNLLLNLGRRNQSLIDRQLDLIDRLESSQQDPDLLDGLFKLDHMVTRQRRNAESLLILAGSKRSRSWSASVPLSDVIRGAISEVADLNRVRFEAQPGNDLSLSGQYAVDLSHLLAELIENATLYSNPSTVVTVRVQRGPTHFRVWVIDSGVGMTEDELIVANQVVTSPPLIEDIATDRVGFQVVGRLAQRFDVRVRLQNNPAGGVAASLDLPFGLFDVLHQDQPVVAEAEHAVRSAFQPTPSESTAVSLPDSFPDDPIDTWGDVAASAFVEAPIEPRPTRPVPAVPVMRFDESLLPAAPVASPGPQLPTEPGALPRRANRVTEVAPAIIPRLAPQPAITALTSVPVPAHPAPQQPMTAAGLPKRGSLEGSFGAAGADVLRRFPTADQPVEGDDASRRAHMLKSFTQGVDAGRDDAHLTDGDAS